MSPHAFLNSGKTPHPEFLCGKIAYPTRRAARKNIGPTQKMRNAPTAHGTHGELEVFKCGICFQFHIGHTPLRRKR